MLLPWIWSPHLFITCVRFDTRSQKSKCHNDHKLSVYALYSRILTPFRAPPISSTNPSMSKRQVLLPSRWIRRWRWPWKAFRLRKMFESASGSSNIKCFAASDNVGPINVCLYHSCSGIAYSHVWSEGHRKTLTIGVKMCCISANAWVKNEAVF